MNKRANLPAADVTHRPHANVDHSPLAFDRWNSAIRAASDDGENTITIYEPIGYDWWTGEGVTAKRISGALRSMGGKDVTVMINSPGGDVWEGLAIYNLLREYSGKVTVKIIGLAASAASFIAMAADEIQIARAGFLMIHNAWSVAMGNKNEMREYADFLDQIDQTIADIYHVRTGIDVDELAAQMDAETWINGTTAIDQGFADSFLASDAVIEDASNVAPDKIAAHRLDTILAKSGMSRTDRRNLIKDLKTGTPSATTNNTPCAVDNTIMSTLSAKLQSTIDAFKR